MSIRPNTVTLRRLSIDEFQKKTTLSMFDDDMSVNPVFLMAIPTSAMLESHGSDMFHFIS